MGKPNKRSEAREFMLKSFLAFSCLLLPLYAAFITIMQVTP
jgi:hypothetical protein